MFRSSRKNSVVPSLLMSAGLLVWLLILAKPATASKGATPDLSSTALKMHKLYLGQPPHDCSLYSVLKVSPNATAAQITKSYRQLSRKYHPDKQNSRQNEANNQNSNKDKLQQVQQAYEILKDDTTRLPYHKYGFTDSNVVITLLMGPSVRHSQHQDESLESLLQLMGFERHFLQSNLNLPQQTIHELRVRSVAARLVEQIRPLVEESLQPGILAHSIAKDCDRWKGLPLGAQIIRCVGRAYRHAGNDYLMKHHGSNKLGTDVTVSMRQQWRLAKNFLTAVLAASRAAATEKVWTVQEERRRQRRRKRQPNQATIEFPEPSLGAGSEFLDPDYYDGIFSEDDDEMMFELEEAEEMKQLERLKAQQTLLHTLRVEALWKVTKIDVDKTIREACNLILSGGYFFFPSHQSSLDPGTRDDGWISTSSGRTIHTEEARIKTAETMRMIGNIMVQRSKEGTAWKD